MKVFFVFGVLTHYFVPLLEKLSEKGLELVVLLPTEKSNTVGKAVKAHTPEKTHVKIIRSKTKKNVFQKEYFPSLPTLLRVENPNILVVGFPYFLQYALQPSLRSVLRAQGIKLVIREIPFQVPPWKKVTDYFQSYPMYDESMHLKSKGVGFRFRQEILMYVRKYCYTHCDGMLAYSSVAEEIMPSYGIGAEKIFVTFNSTDTETIFEQKRQVEKLSSILPENAYRIIHIGRLVAWKRVDLLMDAFREVVNNFPKAQLVIIGNGPENEKLFRQAKCLGLMKNIEFVGGVYDAETLGRYFHVSSVYVLAGMGGLSINDAMAYGLPIICARCDGTEKDLVYEGKNGAYFKENDSYDLAKKIIDLFSNEALRITMGNESLKIIQEKVNLETVSNRYIQALRHIHASKKA